MDNEKIKLEENIKNFLSQIKTTHSSAEDTTTKKYVQRPLWFLTIDQEDQPTILKILNDDLKNINMRLEECSCPTFINCNCCDTFLNTLIVSWNSLFYDQKCIYYYMLVSNS